MSEELSLQYIAGFFDGEGSIVIWKRREKKSPREYNINLEVRINNTNKIVIDKINTLIGGNIRIKSKKDCKPCYEIIISNYRGILNFLEKIYPYLVVKKEIAKLTIEFCRSRLKNYKKPYSEKELCLYTAINLKVKNDDDL